MVVFNMKLVVRVKTVNKDFINKIVYVKLKKYLLIALSFQFHKQVCVMNVELLM